ncbi:MAG: hypothetical protein QNJ98_17975 [Planctomycetota bacterium]|nr:hypothetical protein [Planctomycetota bacterium]
MSIKTNGILGRAFGAILACICLALAGCGGGGGGGDSSSQTIGGTPEASLNQAAYEAGTTRYVYGRNSIANIRIEGAPVDADFSRWAMLHDGSTYRFYCFQAGSDSTIYQFGFDGRAYTFGHNSIAQIEITGTPAEANPASFAMLHDGRDYRLYMRGRSNPERIYQFAFNAATSAYEYGYRSIDVIDTTGMPADADYSRWAMLYDGAVYRQYVAKAGTTDEIYQAGFDGRSYAFGYRSISELSIQGMPANSNVFSFAMLHDGVDYRFYHLAP